MKKALVGKSQGLALHPGLSPPLGKGEEPGGHQDCALPSWHCCTASPGLWPPAHHGPREGQGRRRQLEEVHLELGEEGAAGPYRGQLV